MNPVGIAAVQVRTREWHSFHGEPVPLHDDPFEIGQDFIRALHHRLCQPLTALSCTLEMMQLGCETDAKLTSQLQVAISQSERVVEMMGLFRQLFEAETPQSGHHATLVDGVLSEVVEDLRPLAEMQQVNMTMNGGTEAYVDMPAGQLRQAIWNVVQNCIELTPEQGSVQIELCKGEVTIADTSHVHSDEVANIFDPFCYCQDRKRVTKVSNLPLALTQRIVGAAGGAVRVRSSATAAGRHFELSLPLTKSDHPAGSAA
jgi:signal transduction histidine kinase